MSEWESSVGSALVDVGDGTVDDAIDETADVIAAAVEEIELGVTDADLAVGQLAPEPEHDAANAGIDLGELMEEDGLAAPTDLDPTSAQRRASPIATHRVPEIPDSCLSVAAQLESVARRLRAGELLVSAEQTPATETAALALALSAMLGNRA